MPCFVIHWHAYFPTGLFYLLPGPCLPCSKFDVSGYQFIPTWKKEKFTIRDRQHHVHDHHQNITFKHISSMHEAYIFLNLSHFSFADYWSVFLIVHQYFSFLSLTDIVCTTWTTQRPTGSVLSHSSPAAVCRQRGTSLASHGAQDDLSLEKPPCWGLTQGLGSSGFASDCAGWCWPLWPTWTPAGRSSCSREGRVATEPKCLSPTRYGFTSAFLQVLILWGRQQNLSFLPGSTLRPPLMETTINHTLSSRHKSGHPAVTKFLLQWGRSTQWFVIQSSISLGNV